MKRAIVIVCFVASLSSVAPAQEAGSALPDALREALSENASSVGTLTITWERLRTSPWNEQQLANDLGEDNYAYFERPYVNRVILQDRKYYSFAKMPQADGYGLKEAACDLNYWYNGSGMDATVNRGENPYLSVQNLAKLQESGNARLLRGDYFPAAGFWVPENADDMGRAPLPLIERLVSEGGQVSGVEESVDLNGTACTLVEIKLPETVQRFWLSKQHHHAVVRREERTPSAELICVTVNEEFEQLPGTTLWFPRLIRKQWHRWKSHPEHFEFPIVTEEFRVTELGNGRVDDSVFELNYEHPGSIIADARVAEEFGSDKDRVTYRMPADPEDLDEAIEAAVHKKALEDSRQRQLWTAVIVLNVLAIVVVGFLYIRRR